jgi:hypothetical protein
MATTLAFGHVKPDDGDQGDTVFDALEGNIDIDDAHKHNGTNSDRVDSYNLSRSSVSVPSTGWVADGEMFKQTVTFPAGFTTGNGSDFGSASMRFYFSGGTYDLEELYPTYNRLSALTFELFSPVNNQAYTVAFL